MKNLIITSVTTLLMIISVNLYAKEKHNDANIANVVKIHAAKIIKIAQKARHGQISKMELEKEEGKFIWDVEIITKTNETYDLEIDGTSGKVLENIKDDKDDKEKKN